MVNIKNPVLKNQFEQFTKLGSDEERKDFWEIFSKSVEAASDADQEKLRQAWMENMGNIDRRLKEIGKQLDEEVAEISVYPANAEEAHLIEALLSRMKVRYRVA